MKIASFFANSAKIARLTFRTIPRTDRLTDFSKTTVSTDSLLQGRNFPRNSKRNEARALSFHATHAFRSGEGNCWSKRIRKMKEKKRKREKRRDKEKCATVLFPICSPAALYLGSEETCTRVRTNARTPTKRQPPGSKSPVKAGIVNF